MMETGTFLKENVQEHINRDFIAVKYESGKDSEQFLRFNVKGTPTFVFLDSKGNEIHRINGYYRSDDFIKELETARMNASQNQ
jgi:thioredoxin-related protein